MSASPTKKSSIARRVRAVIATLDAHTQRALPAAQVPRSRATVLLFLTAQACAFAFFIKTVRTTLVPLVKTPEPPRIPAPTSMTRFGMTEELRRAVFRELAEAEFNERNRAITQNTWGGHAWSREDDLGYVQRARGREVASRYNLSLTQVYLVLDEGIRSRWPGIDGQPLVPTTEPLNLRTE
ncbi:MAG: hypothetical protein Q8Q09_05605 [Deltaproteobacteria bacterium]|nr:hypothetical protein [Deltaproteobacteria bacterium]